MHFKLTYRFFTSSGKHSEVLVGISADKTARKYELQDKICIQCKNTMTKSDWVYKNSQSRSSTASPQHRDSALNTSEQTRGRARAGRFSRGYHGPYYDFKEQGAPEWEMQHQSLCSKTVVITKIIVKVDYIKEGMRRLVKNKPFHHYGTTNHFIQKSPSLQWNGPKWRFKKHANIW